MSYGICRVQKMTAGSVKGIEIHDCRKKDGISHTNKDIDWERSELNYDLCPDQNKNFYRAIKKKIDDLQLPKAVRKDAIVMAQVLVTSDHSFFEKQLEPEQVKMFFKDCYQFLADRFGEKNIISATVHMDERTPHMHFNFVPITEDGRLSAKKILTPATLRSLQTDFFEKIGHRYGLERGKEGSTAKHLETEELKLETTKKELKKLQRQLDAYRSNIKNFEREISRINSIQPKKGIGGLKDITLEDVELLKDAARSCVALSREYAQISAEVEQLRARVPTIKDRLRTIDMEKRFKEMEYENKALRASVSSYKRLLEVLDIEDPVEGYMRLNGLSKRINIKSTDDLEL